MDYVVMLHKYIELWNMQLDYINELSGGTCSKVT